MTNITDKVNIQIIISSVRKGRQGEKVAKWIHSLAIERTDMNVEILDLQDWKMPYYDEELTTSEINGNYQSELVSNWVKKIGEADGYIVVTPEYNHGYPAVLKTALDWPYNQWHNKPMAFVSYSTSAGMGLRAVEQLRQVIIDLQMAPVKQAVTIPFVAEFFDENGKPKDPKYLKSAENMFGKLVWWSKVLRFGRDEVEL